MSCGFRPPTDATGRALSYSEWREYIGHPETPEEVEALRRYHEDGPTVYTSVRDNVPMTDEEIEAARARWEIVQNTRDAAWAAKLATGWKPPWGDDDADL